jgi:putative colanic acid biosynthesis acetyltransferase WcaF
MGPHSCLSEYVDCYCVDRIVLGAYATVSQYSFLCTASHDFNDPTFPLVVAPISIGDQAWVTAAVFIGPGVTIGEGAVLTARTVATKDVPAWMVVGGNPAKPLRVRTTAGCRTS